MSRVLFIITQSEIGGAQRFLLEFAPYLVRRGHHIAVLAGEGGDELRKLLHATRNTEHITYYATPQLVRSLNLIKDILALSAIFRTIKNERPDILFLQSTKAGFLGSLATNLYRIYCYVLRVTCYVKAVYRIGGWAFNDPRPWWMNGIVFWMEKLSAYWKDVIIVNSEYDRQLAIDKKIAPADKIIKIYNGVDVMEMNFLSRQEARDAILKLLDKCPSADLRAGVACFAQPEPRRSPQATENEPTGIYPAVSSADVTLIGTIANLYATKGIDHLIEAAHILNTTYDIRHTIYIVIGEGKERPKLEALIKKYNLENNFFLLGRIPNATQYLKAFDIFVLPSVKEGFPWVLLEAMAAEVPVIATKVGAVPEIIEDGKEGLLVPPKDPKALEQKISYLVNVQNNHDRSYFAQNAKSRLDDFSLKKMLKESENVLNLNHGQSPTGKPRADSSRF